MTKIYPPKYLETGDIGIDLEPIFPQGYEIVEIEADDSSYYQDSYQNSTFIELHFKMDHYYNFKKYSRLQHHLYVKEGLGGSLSSKDNIVTLEEPTFTKHSETHYEYTLRFYNCWREKYNRRFVKDPQTKSVTFTLTGNELQHLECIIRSVADWNINNNDYMKIYLGQFSGTAYGYYNEPYNASPFWQASDDINTISYDSTTCIDALKQLSELYGHYYNYNFELLRNFYIPGGDDIPKVDESGRYGIRLYSNVAENATALMYGKNNGLKSITASGVTDIVDILHVNGSERNIITDRSNANHYDSDTLHMPKASFGNRAILLYNGDDFLPATGIYRENDGHSAQVGYVEYVASADGKSVTKFGTDIICGVEESASFPEIYPNRIGTVTAVTENNGNYTIYDSGIDLNYMALREQAMKIIFQDGALAGMEFDVNSGDNGEILWENNNIEDQTFFPTVGPSMPYTYSRTIGSFSLDSRADVKFNLYVYFNYIAGRMGDNFSFSARCYLKKGSSTIFSKSLDYNVSYGWDTQTHVSYPTRIDGTGETIDRTESLTAGDYEIIFEFVVDEDAPPGAVYPARRTTKNYIQGYAQVQTNVFTIVRNEIGGVDVPNATLHPAVGDHYVIVNCEMPTSYVTEAEINLFKEAVKQLAEYQTDDTTYSIEVDGKFMNNNDAINQGLSSGLCLKIQDSSFMFLPRTFRILNVKRPYNNENSPTIEISNVKRKRSRFDLFSDSIIDLEVADANNLKKITANNANLNNTKRQLRNLIEDVDTNQSVLKSDQEEIKNIQDKMDKRISENESQIQSLWKVINSGN